MWEVYCFDVCGAFLLCVILLCIAFYIIRFLSKGSVCVLCTYLYNPNSFLKVF